MDEPLDQVWDQYSHRLKAFIRRRVDDDAAAEDLLQEVFIRVHRHLCCQPDWNKPDGWFYQNARNLIIDHYRRRRELVDLSDALPAEPDWPEDDREAELALSLKDMIDELPEPYVVGHREFYDVDLLTDARALIPRPETECLIEHALKALVDHPAPLIADVGTGCGAIAVTLAKHLPQAKVIATDLSANALELARENAQRLSVVSRIDFRTGSLLEPITETIDLLAANLPYIEDKDWPYLAKTIRGHEPKMAFLGGLDGLDLVWLLG